MKLKALLAVAPLLLTFILTGVSAASAQSITAGSVTNPDLCLANGAYCLTSAQHGDEYTITDPQYATAISFPYEYTTSNGNRWYEIQTVDGGCLNWDPSNKIVYDDSCVPGDPNELWYNHVAGQLINLGGNLDTGHDTWLDYGHCTVGGCVLVASNIYFNGWTEH